MDIAYSINGVRIRLTSERWLHIIEGHDDLAGYYDGILQTVEEPEFILTGQGGTLIAIRTFGARQYLMVIYRELTQDDGFIITAYMTDKFDRKRILWRRQ